MARPKQTHCKRGHAYNEHDTYYREGKGRSCAICNRLLGKLRYRKDEVYRAKKLKQAQEYRTHKKQQENKND